MWEEFIRKGKGKAISKEADAYWDPECYQSIAYAHLALECLMFNISFLGDIVIVRGGKSIGRMQVHIFPTDSKGLTNTSIEGTGEHGTYKITSPH